MQHLESLCKTQYEEYNSTDIDQPRANYQPEEAGVKA